MTEFLYINEVDIFTDYYDSNGILFPDFWSPIYRLKDLEFCACQYCGAGSCHEYGLYYMPTKFSGTGLKSENLSYIGINNSVRTYKNVYD